MFSCEYIRVFNRTFKFTGEKFTSADIELLSNNLCQEIVKVTQSIDYLIVSVYIKSIKLSKEQKKLLLKELLK